MAEAERLASAEPVDIPRIFEVCAGYTEVPEVARGVKALVKVLSSKSVRQAKDFNAHINAFYKLMGQLLQCPEIQLQAFAVRLGIDTLKLGQKTATEYPEQFRQFVIDFISSKNWSDALATCLLEEYASKFLDVRYYLLRELKVLLECDTDAISISGQKRKRAMLPLEKVEIAKRAFCILRQIPEPVNKAHAGGEKSDDSPCILETKVARSTGEYRVHYQGAWLAFLRLPLPQNIVVDVLQHIPGHVFPYIGNPLVLSNFYISSFNHGSLSVSVLSLSGLFYLITKCQLGDPDAITSTSDQFYNKLYELVTPEIFQVKHRTRFLRLMQISLKSTMLPSSYIAAFVKRCARVAVLVETPPAVVWLLVSIYSLMQRNRTLCYPLLHKEPSAEKQFDTDPGQWGAKLEEAAVQVAESSLWEVELLKSHYHPSIARMAALFDTDFFGKTARKMDHEDFLDMSFDTLVEQEMQLKSKKWTKKAPPVAFKIVADEEADPLADLAFTAP